MRRLTLTLTVLVAPFALLACGDDDGDDQTDRCTTEGDLRCNGTMIQSCEMTEDGYLDWMDSSDCADNGLSCLDTGATVECAAGCVDECDAEDETQCSGTEIETCTLAADGCLHWMAGVDCADSGEVCDDATGDATCVEGCVDECENEGDSQCDGSVIETCALTGSGCLEWIPGYDCADGGWLCDDSGGVANCLTDCTSGPGAPTNPSPADGATDVDAGVVTVLDWDDVSGATSYDVYFGTTCPPPAYPDAAYQRTVVSEWAGVALSESSSYCWKVVPRDDAGCLTEGPTWTFDTGCLDPVTGAPTVTSDATATFAPGTTAGTVVLTFSEDVQNVSASLTWSPVTGSGTLDTVTAIDAATYEVDFSGANDGDEYVLTVGTGVTDVCGIPLASAVDIHVVIVGGANAGTTCTDAVDLTGASFPFNLTGTFEGDPATGGSCATPTNAVWYTYTPSVSGVHGLYAENTDTTAWSRLAIFETAACNPYGTEVLCDTQGDEFITTGAYLDAGTTYLILFHTDGDSYPMTDPSITITPPSTDPGSTCDTAIDLTGETMPYLAAGSFTGDPAEGSSCDSTLYNAAWFHYTPSADGWHRISLFNSTLAGADVDLAVFEGTACNPYGTEVFCDGSTSESLSGAMYLTAGTTYTILAASDDSDEPMEDPILNIQELTPDPGETCDQAIDLSGETFPYTATGTFDWAPHTAGSCDSTIYNGAWFQFTPSTTDWYDISGQLTQSTSDDADLVIFEGSGCFPVGAELTCVSASTDTAEAKVQLTAGTPYTIVLASNSSFDDNTDPIIDIAVGSPPPEGLDCSLPATTTSPNHSVDGSGHDCWSWTEDPTDTTDDHTFACDSGTGGDVVVEFTTGASQTTLNWDALIYNEDSLGYIRVDVTESPCASPASSLYCTPSTSNLSDTGSVTVSPNTTYYLWVGDGFSSNYRPAVDLCVW
jgi:hypothetical protein